MSLKHYARYAINTWLRYRWYSTTPLWRTYVTI